MSNKLFAWLADYPQACRDFRDMPDMLKIETLKRIQSGYPENHSNYNKITEQINQIEKGIKK